VTQDTQIELLPQYVEPEEPRSTDVTYDDIGGLGNMIDQVREMIELPLRHPELFSRLGIDPPKGVLLYGPPGTGKTLLSKAVAKEPEANFIASKSSDLLSKWYGESEKQVAKLFARARQVAPTVIFIDEIDSIAPKRGEVTGEVERRVVAQLLSLLDGLEELAEKTDGYTGADLENLVRKAGLQALRSDPEIREVAMSFFREALEDSRRSVTPEMEEEYRKIAERLRRESFRASRRIGFTTHTEGE